MLQNQQPERGSGLAEHAIIFYTAAIRGRVLGGILRREINMRMKSVLVLMLAVMVLGVAAPALADRHEDAKAQVEFGWDVAMKGLWNEATYRWEKAVELDPSYAAAWNDLGIAYEEQGKFDEARKAYEKALQLEPNNNFIRQNYDLFREIYDRQNRRRDR
jgi:Tfp pilus assembly protein PilF